MKTRFAPQSPAVKANAGAQRKANATSAAGDHPLQRLADASRRVVSLQALQRIAACSAQRVAEQEEPLQGRFAPAQRQADEEEEALQGKFATAQRAAIEEEEPLQGRFARVTGSQLPVMCRVDPTTEVNGVPVNDDPGLEHEADVMGEKAAQFVAEDEEAVQGKFGAVAQKAPAAPNRTGLPDKLKAGVEHLSGMSMDGVRVHYNSSKPAQLNALAYAQGKDIHLGPGQEKHLPHEAWHVVQQRVTGTSIKNMPFSKNRGLTNGYANSVYMLVKDRSKPVKARYKPVRARFVEKVKDKVLLRNFNKNGGYYCCAICGFKHKLKTYATYRGRRLGDGCFQVDHKIPYSKGGSGGIRNARVLCGTCNGSLGNRGGVPGMTGMSKYRGLHGKDFLRDYSRLTSSRRRHKKN